MEMKYDALKGIDNGKNVNKVVNEFNIGWTTVLE